VAATGVHTFISYTDNPIEKIVIGGETFDFQAAPFTDASANNTIVFSGLPPSYTQAATALKEIINGEASSIGGFTFWQRTFSGSVTATATDGVVTVTAKDVGSAGNSITTTSDAGSDGSWASPTLTGGVDGIYAEGDKFVASFPQTFTDAEKTQIKINIGADPTPIPTRDDLYNLTGLTGGERYSITDEGGLVMRYRGGGEITVSNWLDEASNTVEVATNAAKYNLVDMQIGQRVNVTAEGGRLEMYLGDVSGNRSTLLLNHPDPPNGTDMGLPMAGHILYSNISNGKSRYVWIDSTDPVTGAAQDSVYVEWDGTKWVIRDGFGVVFWESSEDVADPTLVQTWTSVHSNAIAKPDLTSAMLGFVPIATEANWDTLVGTYEVFIQTLMGAFYINSIAATGTLTSIGWFKHHTNVILNRSQAITVQFRSARASWVALLSWDDYYYLYPSAGVNTPMFLPKVGANVRAIKIINDI